MIIQALETKFINVEILRKVCNELYGTWTFQAMKGVSLLFLKNSFLKNSCHICDILILDNVERISSMGVRACYLHLSTCHAWVGHKDQLRDDLKVEIFFSHCSDSWIVSIGISNLLRHSAQHISFWFNHVWSVRIKTQVMTDPTDIFLVSLSLSNYKLVEWWSYMVYVLLITTSHLFCSSIKSYYWSLKENNIILFSNYKCLIFHHLLSK